MTSQILTIDSPINVLESKAPQLQAQAQVETTALDQQRSRLVAAMRSQYPLDQQVKFLHLQAETDSLLQQLQVVKQQRQALASRTSL